MIRFEVTDMTCGHCASTITRAVKAQDRGATVRIDLAARRVEMDPTDADPGELETAIREAGYTPVRVPAH